MPRKRQVSKRKQRKEAVPVLGAVGMSLSLAGGASAATGPAADSQAMPSLDTALPQITLNEEEMSDVSLGTFYVFDKELAGSPRFGQQIARGCGCGRGCGGCRGCRGCGRGCGCGGCGGCGGGCGCCWIWGYCRVC